MGVKLGVYRLGEYELMKRILVVEDDNSLSVLLRLIMKVQQDDWDVRSAASGVEALSQVDTFQA
jgi:DNA-binding response OmpR family regulator